MVCVYFIATLLIATSYVLGSDQDGRLSNLDSSLPNDDEQNRRWDYHPSGDNNQVDLTLPQWDLPRSTSDQLLTFPTRRLPLNRPTNPSWAPPGPPNDPWGPPGPPNDPWGPPGPPNDPWGPSGPTSHPWDPQPWPTKSPWDPSGTTPYPSDPRPGPTNGPWDSSSPAPNPWDPQPWPTKGPWNPSNPTSNSWDPQPRPTKNPWDPSDPTSNPWDPQPWPTKGPWDPSGPTSNPWDPQPRPTKNPWDPSDPTSNPWEPQPWPTKGPWDPSGPTSNPWDPQPRPTKNPWDPSDPTSNPWDPQPGPTKEPWDPLNPTSNPWDPQPWATRSPWDPSDPTSNPWDPQPWPPTDPWDATEENIPSLPWSPEYIKFLKTNLLIWDYTENRLRDLLLRAEETTAKGSSDYNTRAVSAIYAINKLSLDLEKDCSPKNYVDKYNETVFVQLNAADRKPVLVELLLSLLLSKIQEETKEIRALLLSDSPECKKCGCKLPENNDLVRNQARLVLALSSLSREVQLMRKELGKAIKDDRVHKYLTTDGVAEIKIYPLAARTAKVLRLLEKKHNCELFDQAFAIPLSRDPPTKSKKSKSDYTDFSDTSSSLERRF